MTNHKFYFYLQDHIKLLLYVGIRTNAFFFSKYFGLKNRFTVAELRIEIPSLLGCKYTLFLVIYVHDRKHERKTPHLHTFSRDSESLYQFLLVFF